MKAYEEVTEHTRKDQKLMSKPGVFRIWDSHDPQKCVRIWDRHRPKPIRRTRFCPCHRNLNISEHDHYFNVISASANFEGETVIKEVPVSEISRLKVIGSGRGRCEPYELSPQRQRVIACCEIMSYGGARLAASSLIIAGSSAIISAFFPPVSAFLLPALYSSGIWASLAALSCGIQPLLHTISFVECECTTGTTEDPETDNLRFTARLSQKDYDKAQFGGRSVAAGNSGFGTALAHS